MDQEIESKFYINDLPALEQRLLALGAPLIEPRVHEVNLRFDTPDGALVNARQVLRLRQDTLNRLTYKGNAEFNGGAMTRQEIEFEVSDFKAARRLLEALGYQVVALYEKYRATYLLDGTHVTLDELPYGDFCEIEGEDIAVIQAVSARLGLNWQASIPMSYLALFDRLKMEHGIKAGSLNFVEVGKYPPADLDVLAADSP